jgi:hypothetical protein
MMKNIILIGVMISTLIFAGCGNFGPCVGGAGPVKVEVRPLNDFTEISNAGAMDVYVTLSDEFHVEVVAEETLIPIIETNVSGNTLIIQTQDGTCYRSNTPVEVYVSLPYLEALRLTGSGTLIADVAENQLIECTNSGSGYLSIDTVYAESFSVGNTGSGTIDVFECYVDELSLIQSGSGTIDFGIAYVSNEVAIRHSSSGHVRATILDVSMVDAIMSGSGHVDLSGEAFAAEYTLNSSGKIDALELEAAEIVATNTGSGRIFLWATEVLKATITGSGDIVYRGEPTISFQITGSGDIRSY